MAKSEEQKLVDFFRSPEGERLGIQGDHDNLSPAETAIRAMRSLPASRGPLPAGTTPTREQIDNLIQAYADSYRKAELKPRAGRQYENLAVQLDSLFAAQRPVSPSEPPYKALHDALNWMLHLANNVGKAGGAPEAGEWEAACDVAREALDGVRLTASRPPEGQK